MKGAYRFNDTINFELLGSEGNFTTKLPFLSNNVRFNSVVVDIAKQTISFNNVDVYNQEWIDENYKIITFFGEQDSDEYSPDKETFVNWIKTNSSKVKIEGSKSIQLKDTNDDGTIGNINLYPKTLVTSILNADGSQWIPPESGSGNVGGGGGAGGGGNVSLGTTDEKNRSISFGSNLALKFTWSSQAEGDGILNIKVNGTSKKFQTIAQGPQEIDVTSYLTSATDYYIDFIVEDIVGNKGSLRFLVKVIDLKLTSTFNQYSVQSGIVQFKFTAYGDIDKKLVLKIDNEIVEKENIVAGIPDIHNIVGLTHGIHSIEAYIVPTEGNSSLKSNVLKYKFAYVEEGNVEPVVIIFNEESNYKKGQIIPINFLAYSSATLETQVYFEVNGELIYDEPLSVDRKVQTISLNKYNEGSNTVKIYCNEDSYDSFEFSIEDSKINVSAVTNETLALFLNSNGKTNAASDKEVWTYGNVTTTFNNFNWETDGWKADNNGITALKMTGGSNIEISYQPFSKQNFTSNGKVIELDFMTSNVTNYDSTIIDIKGNNNYGIIAKATNLQFKSSTVTINSKFKENEHIRIAISIESSQSGSNRFIRTYINGVLSGIQVYATNEEFIQENPVNIKIGDVLGSCDVYLYKIRVYDTELTDINLLNNYIADNDNFDEKLSLYNRNQVYTSSYEVSFDKLKEIMPVLIITAPALPTGTKTYLDGVWELSHPIDSTQNWRKEVEFACQGTSSLDYVVKNFQMRLKDQSEENRIALYDGAVREKALTLKVDYASSAGVYNIGNAKIVDELYRKLGADYLNPRQTVDNTIRNSLYGYPVAVFYRQYETETPQFYCKGSLNLSKEALALGYSGKDESWSTEDNVSPLCLFNTADFETNDISIAFKARYNGNDSGDKYSNIKKLIEFVSSCDNANEFLNGNKNNEKCKDYFNEKYLVLYYVFGMIIGGADSFAKNMYLAYFEQDRRWYPQFYDIDTTWGINNIGLLSFGYNSEFKDMARDFDSETGEEKDSYIFNGANSKLWTFVEEAYASEIEALYSRLRGSDYVSLESITDILIKKGIDQYPESIYNEDANLKYIEPYIDGRDTTRLGNALGSTEEHLKYWIQNRLYYLDSKWNTDNYKDDAVILRTATAAQGTRVSFNLTSFRDMYMRAKFATSYVTEQRANKNTAYNLVINYPAGTDPNDTEISIYGASSYTKIGDLSNLYLKSINIAKAKSLTEIKIGSDAYGYTNPNLETFKVGANILLKKIDVTNCTNLDGDIDVSGCSNLEEFYASGTRITNISFPSGGRLKRVFIPNTVESLYISNQKNVESFITSGMYKRIKIENCNLPDLSYVRNSINANKLTHLRLVGVDWELEDTSLIEYIYNKLQGIDENNSVTTKAVLAGKIHINKITKRLYDKYKALWGDDLTITYGEGDNPQFAKDYEVRFVNYDGKQIWKTIHVQENLYAEYRGETPIREETDSEAYEFAGWLSSLTNTSLSNTPITQNTTFIAQYVVTKIFVVTWKNWDGTFLLDTKVKDGDRAYYPSYDPIRPGDDHYAFYTFSGWDKDTSFIKDNMEFIAVYSPGDLAEHIIEWYANDMMLEQDPKVKYGTVLSYDSEMPTSTNQSFYGWSTDPNSTIGKKENEFTAAGPFGKDGKMKLYAVFGDEDRIEIKFNFGDTVPTGNIGIRFSIDDNIGEVDEYVKVDWGDGGTESTQEIFDYSYPMNRDYEEPRTLVKTMLHPTNKYEPNTDHVIKIIRYGLSFKLAYFGEFSRMIESSLAPYVKEINISTDLDNKHIPAGVSYGCSNLDKIIIGSRISNLNKTRYSSLTNPFYNLNLKEISVVEDNPYYDSRSNCNAVIEKETSKLIIGTNSSTIPQGVAIIGTRSFYGCGSLTSITFPDSVTSIESNAFSGCSSLANIIIPDSVTSLGSGAFYGCSSLTSVTLSNKVEEIPSECFCNCSSLNSFNSFNKLKAIRTSAFSNTGFFSVSLINAIKLETIESYAFSSCSKLTSILFPGNVTNMGESVFRYCSSLEAARIAANISKLPDQTFRECRKLATLELPKNLISIGSFAFFECVSLSSIKLPDNLETIGNNAFEYCVSLSSVTFNPALKTIGSNAFEDCRALTSIILYDKVETISSAAFLNCYNITIVNLKPTIIETIGNSCFSGCRSLISIEFPTTLKSIGSQAFYGCSSIAEVSIPKLVDFIGPAPFALCTSLTTITVNSANEHFTTDEDGVLYNKDLTTLIQFPPGKNPAGDDGYKEYTIKDTVTTIGDYAFASCVHVEVIVSPNTITSIGNYAFANSSLAYFEVASSTETIGSFAFSGCSKLNNLIINNGVKTIGERAFIYCIALGELILPDSVTSIGYEMLRGSYYLESLTLSNGLTAIPDSLCRECSRLKSIIIPDSVITIGSLAFEECGELKNILIGASVKSIESQAFHNDSAIRDRQIRMKPSIAPTIAVNTFDIDYLTIANNCSVIVNFASGNAILNNYLEATNWVLFKEIITSILAYTVNNFDFGGIIRNVNDSNETILTATPNSGYKFTNWYHYTPGDLIIPEDSLNPTTFDDSLKVTYKFKLNENGYYESSNQRSGNSFSKARFNFRIDRENQGVLIKYINYSELGRDFGIIGKVDTLLPNDNSTNSTTDYVNFKNQSSIEEKRVVIAGIAPGEHFIEVKYVKDSGNNVGDDSLQVKVYVGDLKTEIKYGDMYSQSPEINVGVIDVTDTTKQPLSLIAKFEEEV